MPKQGEVDRVTAGRQPNSNRSCDLTGMLLVKSRASTVRLTEDHILSILCVRRGREAALGRELFSDPAWDILLELYAARLGERRMTVAEIARSIETPQSTAERWISALSARGLVNSIGKAADQADRWIELSRDAEAHMSQLVDHWGSAFCSI